MHPQNREVGKKLLIATAAMFTLPIISYFIASYVFREKESADSWAAGTAILMTNIVVGAYCAVAYLEDRAELAEKKDVPRVGAFKDRTD